MSKPYWTKENFPISPAIRNPGGSLVFKAGMWRFLRPIIDQDKCTKCGLCATFCPDLAISKADNGSFIINLDYCKGCGICANECPVKSIKLIEDEEVCKTEG